MDIFSKEYFMREAFIEARRAYSLKETPIGAVVVFDGKIIGRGCNMVEVLNDATKHAEMCAINEASKNLSRWRLSGCEIFVTMEPCFMCAGAIVNSRIEKIYVGARHKKNRVVDKNNSNKNEYLLDNGIEVEYGILEEECSRLLTSFFSEKRKKLI